ncbi:MAG TPA: type IX secretion system membrane protein PorP/SprF [Bacteroidia bacterium]|nr:type IX secretion system membrane protein PorP/SprF [Bacteroidia bacterium]HNT79279.1 type IX secretion system membrane protein PorP/SprF [Bacteroidia bacterium]
MKKLLTILFTAIVLQSNAQDPEFTQFYANPLYLNPAFAGSVRCPRVALNYRNQWPALAKTYITYSASYDQYFDAISGGLGLIVLNDKAGEGTITTSNISGIYSYQLNVSRDFSLQAGLQATYVQKRIDWDKLTFGDMIDPRYGFVYPTQETRPNESRSFVDFSAGIVGYSTDFYGGVAVHHLTQPDEAFIVEGSSELPMKITLHGGAMLAIGESKYYSRRYKQTRDDGTFISPNILYQQQGPFNQINLGMYILHSPLVGGLWYRGSFGTEDFLNSDSFIALVGFQKGYYKFGYSYDVTVSQLSNATGGSHEVSFGMQFECKPKRKRFRTISCPSF